MAKRDRQNDQQDDQATEAQQVEEQQQQSEGSPEEGKGVEPASEPREFETVEETGETVDTNAGPDAIQGTVADQDAKATAPESHAGENVDTNANR